MIHRTGKFTMETKIVLLVVTILLLSVDHGISGLDEVPEFQYPCYVDVCTYPRQYCNSDERRCSPCSRAICHAPSIPTPCRYICIKYQEVTTTIKPTTSPSSALKAQESSDEFEFTSLHLLMGYSVVATTILIVIVAIGTVCYLRNRGSKDSQDRNIEKQNNGGQYSRVDTCIDAEKLVNCPTCGQPGKQGPHPENHQTYLGNETLSDPPSYRYKEYDGRTNVRMNPPIVSTPSDSTVSAESAPKVVTNGSRYPQSLVTGPSVDEGTTMHAKMIPDDSARDVELQNDLLHGIQNGNAHENTRRKVMNV